MNPKPRLVRFAALVAFAALISGGPGLGQDGAVVSQGVEVRDRGHMFGDGAIRRAREVLGRDRVPVLIETVPSLDGQTIGELAERRHEQDPDAVVILLAKKEKRISDLQVPDRLSKLVPEAARHSVRDAFLAEFKKNDYDAGLVRGAEAIAALLAKAGGATTDDAGPAAAGDVVERNRVRLTLAGARHALAGAEAKAKAVGVKANIAVVDDGGHLLAFARLDGGRPASGYTAITKATTAATFRQATGPIPADAKPEVQLATGLGLQAAAAASGGKVTTLLGGVPIVVDGQVIGALGVGGGTGEQDKEIATAGAEAIVEALKAAKPAEPKKVEVEINGEKKSDFKIDFTPEGRIEKAEPPKDEPKATKGEPKAEAPPRP